MNGGPIRISTPLDRDVLAGLRAGDRVVLDGDILVFRDEVHRILTGMMECGGELPFELADRALYYCGPTPPRHGMAVGSAGPTTSGRMDMFTPALLERGLAMTIGKGDRSPEAAEAHRRHGAVYMVATGGTGALIAKGVISARVLAFPDLGAEAAREFTVSGMELVVGIDTVGGSAFASRG